MRIGSGPVRLIGRRRELQELETCLDQAEAHVGNVVLVSGDPGIGKTSLVRAFQGRATTRGAASLSGSATDIDGADIPFGPIVQALRDAFDRDLLSARLLPVGIQHELSQLIPALRRDTSSEAFTDRDEYARVRLFESVRFVLADLARRTATILALEDIHWADQSTLDLISFLGHNLDDERVVLVLTFRDAPPYATSRLGRWVAEFARRSNVQRVELGPFQFDDTSALVTSVLGREAGAHVSRLIHERSSGNPYAIEELAAAAANNTHEMVPTALRDSILVSLGGLGPPGRKVAAAGAVLGPPFDDDVLPAVAGSTPEEVLRGLRELVDARIVAIDPATGDYDFRHGLTREVAYLDLLVDERRTLHERAADALSARRMQLSAVDLSTVATITARIAHHRAAAGDPEAAILASLDAGRAAFDVLAFAEAAAHLRTVVERWPDLQRPPMPETDRASVALQAAEAMALCGDAAAGIEMAETALSWLGDHGPRELRGRFWERLAEYRFNAGRPGRLEAARCAVRLLPLAAGIERTRALIGLGEELDERGDGAGAAQAYRHAVTNARRAGSPSLEAYARSLVAVQHGGDGIAEAVRLTREALQLASGPKGPPYVVGWSYVNLTFFLAMLGRIDDALAAGEEGIALPSALMLPETVRELLFVNTADLLIDAGRWAEAEERIGALASLSDMAFLFRQVIAHRLGLLRGLDMPTTGPGSLGDALDRIDPSGSRSFLGLVLQAEHALAGGDVVEVRSIVSAITVRDVPNAMHAWPEATAYRIGMAAEVIAAARARANQDGDALTASKASAAKLLNSARRLEARVAPDHRVARLFLATTEAEASRIDGPGDGAAWEALTSQWAQVKHSWWTAYCRLRHAEALAATPAGTLPRIRELLTAAILEARALGAAGLASDIEATARQLRVRLDEPLVHDRTAESAAPEPASTAPTASGLSKREREVLALVAEGLTNREIGERLFISPKTAGVHVSNILAKLHAHGRVEAAIFAQRAGLSADSADAPPGEAQRTSTLTSPRT